MERSPSPSTRVDTGPRKRLRIKSPSPVESTQFQHKRRSLFAPQTANPGRPTECQSQSEELDVTADSPDSLGDMSGSSYDRSGALKDFEQPMQIEETPALTSRELLYQPAVSDNLIRVLESLESILDSNRERLKTLMDPERTLREARDTPDAAPLSYLGRAVLPEGLGGTLESLVSILRGTNNSFETPEDSTMQVEDSLVTVSPNYPDRAAISNNLASMLESLIITLKDMNSPLAVLEGLDRAVLRTEGALTTYLSQVTRSDSLASTSESGDDPFVTLESLEETIAQTEDDLAEIPVDDPGRAAALSTLSALLEARYERSGAVSDLNQAIMRTKEALAVTPTDHSDREIILGNLGGILGTRYQRLGNADDLEKAILQTKESLAMLPFGHPTRASRLRDLGIFLNDRFQRFGVREDLEQAIISAQEALAATPTDRSSYARYLDTLGTLLRDRHTRFGALEDLEKATKLAEKALSVAPTGHPDRATILGNLARILEDRYDRLGVMGDLEEAITRIKEALSEATLDSLNQSAALSNLGSMLENRHNRLGAIDDLEEAIVRTREALTMIPSDQPDREAILSNLGRILKSRYMQLGNVGDLEEAITRTEEALDMIPPDHPARADGLGNLGAFLHKRYERLGARDDLEKSIMCAREAIATTPLDNPNRAFKLNSLGNKLMLRFPLLAHSTSDENFGELLHSYQEAWDCKMAPLSNRIIAAYVAAHLLTTRKRWQEASFLFEEAVKMLLQSSPRLLERDDQQHQLSKMPEIAADAASVALEAGSEASHCLRLLELGRGIIMGFVIDSRSDLSELKLKYPDVFDKFNRLRIEIDSPFKAQKGYGEPAYQRRHQRKQVTDEIEETLVYIRQLPGFEWFQLPPPPEDLMAVASDGPIILFNSTQYRSDAIIVTDSAIISLPLPKLLYADVTEKMQQISRELVRGPLRTYASRNKQMAEILLWLWDAAVEPVLNNLQLTGAGPGLTRIWWIGVGALSMAPFHAAGDHSPGSTRNTFHRVISSYIPTIKALSYARQKKLELFSKPDPRLLLVTMPTTAGQPPLKKVMQEVEDIVDVVKDRVGATLLNRPSATEVLREIPSYHIIHFACHGVSDENNPSDSHLLLLSHDSPPAGPEIANKLTVRAISNVNINHAQLAYLSACSTADNRSTLADETIHIASGFQLAGFSHVLATMWQSNDAACHQVSREFYGFLFDGARVDDGHRKVGTAFHEAVRRLRDQYLGQPIKWAPFIHTGA